MASEELMHRIAADVALGVGTAELAQRHGYSRRGMRKLIHSPAVQALVAVECESLADLTEQYRAELVGLGETAIENVRRCVEDPSHPRCVETSRWLLDRVAFPPRSALEVNVEAGPSAEAVRLLTEAFNGLQASKAAQAHLRVPALEEHLIEAHPHGSTTR